ncbi:MAG TPA: SRPBCC domain-containing protein [Acidimicrobiales bacterium]|nr:SRPBCC domain-containing protein [Acidimicrobiales bacterium]
MPGPDVLRATIAIAATPEEVFAYLIDPSLLVQWIGTWADLDPVPGGLFALDIEGTAVRGRYVSVEPPDRVVFTWGVPGDAALPAGSTTVEILLRAHGDETIVELLHHDLPSDQRAKHEAGWASMLPRLAQTADATGSRERDL